MAFDVEFFSAENIQREFLVYVHTKCLTNSTQTHLNDFSIMVLKIKRKCTWHLNKIKIVYTCVKLNARSTEAIRP